MSLPYFYISRGDQTNKIHIRFTSVDITYFSRQCDKFSRILFPLRQVGEIDIQTYIFKEIFSH